MCKLHLETLQFQLTLRGKINCNLTSKKTLSYRTLHALEEFLQFSWMFVEH